MRLLIAGQYALLPFHESWQSVGNKVIQGSPLICNLFWTLKMSWCYHQRNESKFWTNIAIGQEDSQQEDLSKHDVGS